MFKHWSYNPTRSSYTGTYDTANNLPSGLYNLDTNSYGEPVAKQLELRKDTMITFEHGPLPGVMAEINTFWQSAPHYKKLGVSHKRGILLYGPPGCGKTGIISTVIQDTIERNGLAFQVDDICDFESGFTLARQIENGRPMVALIEDIEQIIEAGDEETLLEVMDGASSLGDGLLFIATTNHLNKVPPRIRCRPSRIDTLMEIGFPNEKQRYEYLRFLLANDGDDEGRMGRGTSTHTAREWAEKTNDFSLAALKELVISVHVYRKPLDKAIDMLRELAKDAKSDV